MKKLILVIAVTAVISVMAINGYVNTYVDIWENVDPRLEAFCKLSYSHEDNIDERMRDICVAEIKGLCGLCYTGAIKETATGGYPSSTQRSNCFEFCKALGIESEEGACSTVYIGEE